MRMIDIIEKKRDNLELTAEEIKYFIEQYVLGNIPDYQVSSLLMAIYFNGLTDLEATNLTEVMLKSGDVINLEQINGIKVDKHSTGGVGDKTSLVLAPLVASLDVKFAKMSGRGLGHTGGTLDKLEAIPGFNINLSNEEFIKQVNDLGLAIVGQTGNLVPADKKLYALRDITGTVSQTGLIASSIMSKKLASGADAICLDVKVGSGAFMKTLEDARILARLMVQIGRNCGRKVTALLTDMEEPLGLAIGNTLEVIEAVNTLKGYGPKDLENLCLEIGAYLVLDAKKADTKEEAYQLLKENINNGLAYQKFVDMVIMQGGDASYITNLDKFPKAKEIIAVSLEEEGYVVNINALEIGVAAMMLGAGRETKEDKINMQVGIVLNKKIGDFVSKNDPIAYIHTDGKNTLESIEKVKKAYRISSEKRDKILILDVIR